MDRTLKITKNWQDTNMLYIILNHFLLLKNWIKKDQNLIANCLHTILELPKGSIQIKTIAPIRKEIITKNINDWRVEIDTIVAGKTQSKQEAVTITIHLKETDNLSEYVAGGTKRKLLEEVFYPNFIGEEIDCITNIKFESPDQLFYLKAKGNSGCIGISTQL